MKKPVKLIIFWLVNSVLLYLATQLFPGSYVLGNMRFGVLSAAIVAGLFWTFLVWVFKKALKKFKVQIADDKVRILFYIIANFVAVWLVARFAPYTGFGLTSFVWALGLGVAGAIAQFAIWKLVKGHK